MVRAALLLLILALVPDFATGRAAAGVQGHLRKVHASDGNDEIGAQDGGADGEDDEDDDDSDDDVSSSAPGLSPAPATASAPAPAVAAAPEAPPEAPPPGLEPNATQAATAATAQMEAEMEEMVSAERQALTSTDPIAQLKEQLAAYEWLEDQLLEKLEGMSEEVYRGKIAVAEAAVAKDTTPGMAKMLGDMRLEMHALAAPFYTKALEQQIAEVREKQQAILAQIAALEGGNATAPQALNTDQASEKATIDSETSRMLWMVLAILVLPAIITAVVVVCIRRNRQST